jgi:hypothetical protein
MLNEDYRDMLHASSGGKVKFLLVGAYALAGRGYPRALHSLRLSIAVRF